MDPKHREEAAKLLASNLNALSVILLAAGLFGSWLSPERGLASVESVLLVFTGSVFHLVGQYVLSFMRKRENEQ